MKAILIIDMPEHCIECPCADFTRGLDMCRASLNGENIVYGGKPNWCPLKPLNKNTLKSGNKEYLIYQRDWLYKNLDREIEMLKSGKKYFDEILGENV